MTSLTDRVDSLFAEWDKQDSPGAALAIIKDGSIIYKHGYGSANLDLNCVNSGQMSNRCPPIPLFGNHPPCPRPEEMRE